MGSPFDYPLSSRLDENDAIFILDKVLVPWENVFVYDDVEKANNFFPRTGFLPRALLHGCTRLAVKLDFIAGLLLKAVEATGTKDYRGVQANVGEVIAWRNLFWALSDAMVRDPKPWIGEYVLPNPEPGAAYQIIAPMAYTKVKNLIEQTVGLRPHLPQLPRPRLQEPRDPPLSRQVPARLERLRGGRARQAHEAAVGLRSAPSSAAATSSTRSTTSGSTEEIRRYCLFGAQASGNADRFKGFAEQCMAEYDIDGWKVPDLTDPGELSYHVRRGER